MNRKTSQRNYSTVGYYVVKRKAYKLTARV